MDLMKERYNPITQPSNTLNMQNENIKTIIESWVPDLEFTEDSKQYVTVVVPRESLRTFLRKLKDDDQTKLDFMFGLTGVDYPKYLEVIYHLESTSLGLCLVVKVRTEDRDENCVIDTVSDIYRTADLNEREVFDLLGVRFEGHPDLRRLFLTDDWVGYPLRKDYVDTVNIVNR